MHYTAALLIAYAQSSAPVPLNSADWITQRDYPDAAMRHDSEGTVTVRLDVDRGGMVSNCQVVESAGLETPDNSGFEALDTTTCNLLRSRARFSPAENAEGQPTDGVLEQRVTWRLPPARRVEINSWSAIVRFVVNSEGAILRCSEEDLGEVPPEVGHFCRMTGAFPPAVLLAMRGGPGAGEVEVISETTMLVDGLETFPRVYQGADRRLISMQSSRFEISETGRAENCRIEEAEGDPRLHARICDHMYDGPFIHPVDENGSPQRKRVTVIEAYSVPRNDRD